jgi:hypothetical protein
MTMTIATSDALRGAPRQKTEQGPEPTGRRAAAAGFDGELFEAAVFERSARIGGLGGADRPAFFGTGPR